MVVCFFFFLSFSVRKDKEKFEFWARNRTKRILKSQAVEQI